MNFFVERPASHSAVIRACGIALKTHGHPVDDVDGYVQIT